MTFPQSNAEALGLGFANAAGLKLTPAGEKAVVAAVGAALSYGDDGAPILVNTNGDRMVTATDAGTVREVSFAEYVENVASSDASYVETPASKQAPAPIPAKANLTERMLAARQQQKAGNKALSDSIHANPWANGSFNLTHQMVLAKNDPDRAARLKAEAGR